MEKFNDNFFFFVDCGGKMRPTEAFMDNVEITYDFQGLDRQTRLGQIKHTYLSNSKKTQFFYKCDLGGKFIFF